jgi:hypothetical protein
MITMDIEIACRENWPERSAAISRKPPPLTSSAMLATSCVVATESGQRRSTSMPPMAAPATASRTPASMAVWLE